MPPEEEQKALNRQVRNLLEWARTYVDPDVIPRADMVPTGITIEICEEPWTMDVMDASPPDHEGMVTFTGADGRTIQYAQDWPITQYTQRTAELEQSLVMDELTWRGEPSA